MRLRCGINWEKLVVILSANEIGIKMGQVPF